MCGFRIGLALLAAAYCAPWTSASVMADDFPANLTRTSYAQLYGWAYDDHQAALDAFLRSCDRMLDRAPSTKPSGVSGEALQALCHVAQVVEPGHATAFFEDNFSPYRIDSAGLLTGYFEPQVEASFERVGPYQHPLYARPSDLVELPADARGLGITEDVTWGRAVDEGFEAFPDRQAIMAGALQGRGLELVYLKSPIDAFFIHIQGSARLAMTDGTVQRVNFAGKSGHQYTPIGRTLVERGDLALEDVTMDSLRAWLEDANPSDRDTVLASNRSFIFFAMAEDFDPSAGPVAAAGVPLSPGRSLAIDRHLHTFGTPVFLQSGEPLPGDSEPLSRLLIAQDTGSAIVGPARGDIFIGSGAEAGSLAGRVNQPVSFTILVPNAVQSATD